MRTLKLTAIIEREDDGFVALCPELDVGSQGDTFEEARQNLREAVQLFVEHASDTELLRKLSADRSVETLEVQLG